MFPFSIAGVFLATVLGSAIPATMAINHSQASVVFNESCVGFEFNTSTCCCICIDPFFYEAGVDSVMGLVLGIRLTEISLASLIFLLLVTFLIGFVLLYPPLMRLHTLVWWRVEKFLYVLPNAYRTRLAIERLPATTFGIGPSVEVVQAEEEVRTELEDVAASSTHVQDGGSVVDVGQIDSEEEEEEPEEDEGESELEVTIIETVEEYWEEEEEGEWGEYTDDEEEDEFDEDDEVEEDEHEIPRLATSPTVGFPEPIAGEPSYGSAVKKKLRRRPLGFLRPVVHKLFLVRLPRSGFLIAFGCVLGVVLRATGQAQSLNKTLLEFNADLVLLFLLPPITLKFGLECQVTSIVRDFALLCVHCIFGTLAVGLAVSSILYFALGPTSGLSFLHYAVLVSVLCILSPGTSVEVLRARSVNTRIRTMVANEAFFKKIVAVVLYSIFSGAAGQLDPTSSDAVGRLVGLGVAKFFIVVPLSLFLGFVVGFVAAFVSRFSFHSSVKFVQSGIVLVFGYISWFVSGMFLANGALGAATTALVMAKYIKGNMGKKSRVTLAHIVDTMVNIGKGLIELYMGMSMASLTWSPDWTLIVLLNVLLTVFRMFSVWSLDGVYALLSKVLKSPSWLPRIPVIETFARSLIATRGFLSYALVWVLSPSTFPHREVLLSTISLSIVWTLIVQGTTFNFIMGFLPIRRQRIQIELVIKSLERILGHLDEIVLACPSAIPIGQEDSFTMGQRQLRRSLANRINYSTEKLKKHVWELLRGMRQRIHSKKVGGSAGGKSLTTAADSFEMTVGSNEIALSQHLLSMHGPFLSSPGKHVCRKRVLEEHAVRLLKRLHLYMKTLPEVVIQHNLILLDLDHDSFVRMVTEIRPRLVHYRRWVSRFLAVLIKERLEHKFWSEARKQKRETAGSRKNSLFRSCFLWIDMTVQKLLSRKTTTSEREFVKTFIKYRTLDVFLLTLSEKAATREEEKRKKELRAEEKLDIDGDDDDGDDDDDADDDGTSVLGDFTSESLRSLGPRLEWAESAGKQEFFGWKQLLKKLEERNASLDDFLFDIRKQRRLIEMHAGEE